MGRIVAHWVLPTDPGRTGSSCARAEEVSQAQRGRVAEMSIIYLRAR